MATQSVDVLIEGGKATAAPPLGPALGPLGVNIGQIVADINKKTESFRGMQVPVKIKVDSNTKKYEIEIGTPPASGLIKKEAGIQKGSANPKQDKIADLRIENIIKIAKMKESKLLGRTLKERVKEVIGTCNSMGVMVEGVSASEAIALVNSGRFDKEIMEGKTELSAQELKELEEERKKLAAEMEGRHAEFEKKAKEIIAAMAGKERGAIKGKLTEAGIPLEMIEHLLPVEGAAADGKAADGKKAAAPKAKEEPKDKKAEKKQEKK